MRKVSISRIKKEMSDVFYLSDDLVISALTADKNTTADYPTSIDGFTAIIVAWLAKFNTFVMILIAFLLAFLEKGAIEIASQFNLNNDASNIITGIILFFILGSEFFINYRVIVRGGKEGSAK